MIDILVFGLILGLITTTLSGIYFLAEAFETDI